MEKEKFQVIFSGEFLEDKSIPEIKQNLLKLFKAEPLKIDAFFSGKKLIVKKNISRQTALKYIKVLQNAGIICHIKSHTSKTAESPIKETVMPSLKSVPHPAAPTIKKEEETLKDEDVKEHIDQPEKIEETFWSNKKLFIKFSFYTFIVMALASWVVLYYFQKPLRHTIQFSEIIGLQFVHIPSGTFTIGSPTSETDRYEDEKQVDVTLTEGFYLQTTEVTQWQWRAVMGKNPSFFQDCGDNCPVEHVSWNDVQEFIHQLNLKEGVDIYRLPTEAEWEYACRAGSKKRFCYGDDEQRLREYAWFAENSEGRTHPVGQKKPNAWGLYDMHGNVWEWCQDWYGEYPGKAVIDPKGPSKGPKRVNRGASVVNASWNVRNALRTSDPPDFNGGLTGFRIVKAR